MTKSLSRPVDGNFGDAPASLPVDLLEALREAIVQSSSDKSKAIPYRPKRSLINWVDFLVILATVLVFGAVVAANNPHARAQTRAGSTLTINLPEQASAATDDVSLIKARIRLAIGAPWS